MDIDQVLKEALESLQLEIDDYARSGHIDSNLNFGICACVYDYVDVTYEDAGLAGDVEEYFDDLAKDWPHRIPGAYMVPDPAHPHNQNSAAVVYNNATAKEMWLEGPYAAYREDLLRFVLKTLEED